MAGKVVTTNNQQGQADNSVSFPIVLIDDDQWLTVCGSLPDLQLAVEPDFLDDIVAGYDALARPLQLFTQEKEGSWGTRDADTMARVSGAPEPQALQRDVRRFFSLWTDEEAPEFGDDLLEYINSVKSRVETVRTRRKARRPEGQI
ncbi:hypothetical protein AB0E08_00020 [Streptomyces sp. NPDC048281]|uniref:hypothetical protein n=1 Tax=Streptomyces sp. NPDC048281 TaxID=3154715 RepID=UPI00344375CF